MAGAVVWMGYSCLHRPRARLAQEMRKWTDLRPKGKSVPASYKVAWVGVLDVARRSRVIGTTQQRQVAAGRRPAEDSPRFLLSCRNESVRMASLNKVHLHVIEEPVRFPALDGHGLGGILYSREGLNDPERVIVFSPGGGVAAVRYRRFARFLARSGVPVFAYDYRGIGESRPSSLRGFSAVLEEWSEFDCGGAIAWIRARYPNAEMIGIAHSVGTLMFGGAANAGEVTRFVMVALIRGITAIIDDFTDCQWPRSGTEYCQY